MRTLLLFRGAPGVGKSTYIEKNGLKPYTLCADDIRLLCQSPVLSVNGNTEITQSNDGTVWKTLFTLLVVRMQRGEFTVIDATNSKTSEMNKYKKLCQEYRYRIFLVDFTDVPIEECKKRNSLRAAMKQVPEAIIDKMYSRFKTQRIPSGITVIKPEELDKVFMKKIDLSEYKVIEDWGLGYCLGNVVKYICRAGKKYVGDKQKELQDLKKAKWYLERRLEEHKNGVELDSDDLKMNISIDDFAEDQKLNYIRKKIIKNVIDCICEEIDTKFYTALELLDTEINRMEDETI